MYSNRSRHNQPSAKQLDGQARLEQKIWWRRESKRVSPEQQGKRAALIYRATPPSSLEETTVRERIEEECE
jgi:hypothetical protein